MDTAYLQQHVSPLLSKALAATLAANPSDQCDYLAHYLLQSIARKQAAPGKQAAALKLTQQDTEHEVKTSSELKSHNDKQQHHAQQLATHQSEFDSFLATTSQQGKTLSLDDLPALLTQFSAHLARATHASAVYIAKFDQPTGDDAVPSLKYISVHQQQQQGGAATSTLLGKRLNKGQGVTLRLFSPVDDEEEEPQLDDDGNAKPKLEKQLRKLFIPSVLMGPYAEKLHHFPGAPRPGSYLAIRFSYEATLDESTLDEAIEKEAEIVARQTDEADEKRRTQEEQEQAEEEQAEEDAEAEDDGEDAELTERKKQRAEKLAKKAADAAAAAAEPAEQKKQRLAAETLAKQQADEDYLIGQLTKSKRHFVLCLDTIGNNASHQQLTQSEIDEALKRARELQMMLQRLDRAQFRAEMQRRKAIVEYSQKLRDEQGGGEEDEASHDVETKYASELETLSSKLAAASKSHHKTDVRFALQQQLLLAHKQHMYEWSEALVFRGPLVVLQALFYSIGYKQSDVVLAENLALPSKSEHVPEWRLVRRILASDELYKRLREYEPRSLESNSVEAKEIDPLTFNRSSQLKSMLESVGIDPETSDSSALKERNYVLGLCADYVAALVAVRARVAKEATQARIAAREAKKAAAEAEAEAKRAAEEEAEEKRLAAEEEAESKRQEADGSQEASEEEEESAEEA